MIERSITEVLREAAIHYPVVTVTGPRQAGKTTLCTMTFDDMPHVSLEPLDVREQALEDPRGFLDEYKSGAVIDEVQHAPGLLSYLQEEVDKRPDPGRFILTGSQHFGLVESITQSLAGRTAMLTLFPPSLDELMRFDDPPGDLFETLWTGAYPRIHHRGIPAERWLGDYVTTYVQRDVRQALRVMDLNAFSDFLRLCAGRSAQVLNLSSLGGDAGISHNTARSWLSVLEASYLFQRIPAWHRNLRKQTTKAPKLHMIDSGLLCHLLGIHSPDQLRHHPLRGSIFESWVVSEVLKSRTNRGLPASLFHFRDAKGLEVDLVLEGKNALGFTEVKSGATVTTDYFRPLNRIEKRVLADEQLAGPLVKRLVYGGEKSTSSRGIEIVSWRQVAEQDWV